MHSSVLHAEGSLMLWVLLNQWSIGKIGLGSLASIGSGIGPRLALFLKQAARLANGAARRYEFAMLPTQECCQLCTLHDCNSGVLWPVSIAMSVITRGYTIVHHDLTSSSPKSRGSKEGHTKLLAQTCAPQEGGQPCPSSVFQRNESKPRYPNYLQPARCGKNGAYKEV